MVPLAAPLLRPIAKAAIKGGIYAYDSALELYHQAASGMNELVTQAQQEASETASAPHRGRATAETG